MPLRLRLGLHAKMAPSTSCKKAHPFTQTSTLTILLILLFLLARSENFSLTLDSQHQNFLSYRGDATQYPDHIELTVNGQFRTSRLYYTDPVHLFDSTNSSQLLSFSTSFTFQIVQYTTSYYPADGMAFIMSPSNTAPLANSSGGFLGLLNSSLNGDSHNHLFAVEFDTFRNAEFQDPADAHIGIDVNNLTSLATVVPPDDLKLSKNLTLTAWIDYMAARNLLQVRLSRNTTKPETIILSLEIDLGKVIQDAMYVGFSAATGANSDELHRLYSWNFSIISTATGPSSFGTPPPVTGPSSFGPSPPVMGDVKKKKNILMPVLAALFAALICISLLAAGCICYKRRKMEGSNDKIRLPITKFTYSQLKAATKNFSIEEMLGKGGFGKVYKGVLPDGNIVAVKVLFQETTAQELQLVAELSVISHLRHRNLLSLTGWCHTKEKLLLVYDYMPNGSLDKYLFSTSNFLSWQQRYNIVLGVAEGLAYLHTGWEQKIVHRDVKASNVLLDSNFRAHLGDFGLAKLLDYDKTEETMTRAGTFGYIAPELVYTGKASDKSDVYSFGILILEVGSGRKVLDTVQGKFLLEWIWLKHEKGKLLDAADPKLEISNRGEMRTILLLGLLCCQEDHHHRPSMRRCCNILKGNESLPQMQSLVYINSNESASVSASSSSPLSRTQPSPTLVVSER